VIDLKKQKTEEEEAAGIEEEGLKDAMQ